MQAIFFFRGGGKFYYTNTSDLSAHNTPLFIVISVMRNILDLISNYIEINPASGCIEINPVTKGTHAPGCIRNSFR